MALPITVSQAAERLGVTRGRVHALIRAKRLQVTRLGNQYVIDPAELRRLRPLKPGRPRKKSGSA